MTKIELIHEVVRRCRAKKIRLPHGVARPIIEMALEVIVDIVSTGEPVELMNFGKFSMEVRAPKKGYDFKAGVTVDLPEAQVVVFTPYRRFRNAVRD